VCVDSLYGMFILGMKNVQYVRLLVYITYIRICCSVNPSAWGHLNPSSYCDVGRFFYGVFKF